MNSLQEKDEAKKNAMRIFKDKEQVDQQDERIQQVAKKLYKDIPEVSMVIEATLEEQV